MPAFTLRFLVDVSLGVIATSWLKENFPETAAVRDRDPRMLDDAILKWANLERRIVITMDRDFGELVYRDQKPHTTGKDIYRNS